MRLLLSSSPLIVAIAAHCLVAAASEVAASTPVCSGAAQATHGSASVATAPVKKATECLIDAGAIPSGSRIVDVRNSAEFSALHIPSAEQRPLPTLLNGPADNIVIYGDGTLRADAYALCERVRRYGVKQYRVVDGGIAAWMQTHAPDKALKPSRLSDNEITAALLSNENTVITLDGDFSSTLTAHKIMSPGKNAKNPGRTILLASSSSQLPAIQQRLPRKQAAHITLYWIGPPAQLDALLSRHIAQDKKRLQGPGRSSTCSAL